MRIRVLTPGILGIAAIIGGGIFAYKLECYEGLGTTSDLYQFAQLATSWLRGQFLTDNCYGSHLSIHTYFFCPLLAVFVVPFGVPGLLLALSLAAAAGFIAMVKIQRLLGVPGPIAAGWAALATLMPLSLHAYQDLVYGFHIELLMPAMALWLVYFLLRRHWPGTVAMALVLISVKEEAPLLVAVCGGVVLAEDALRLLQAPVSGRARRRPFNASAAAVILVAGLALPVLLHILRTHPPSGYSLGSFQRIVAVDGTRISGRNSLVTYFLRNIPAWLSSDALHGWLGLALPVTFGLIVLRPHFLVIGSITTLIAWLIQDDPMWSPRLAPQLAFFQIAGTLAFVSAYTLFRSAKAGRGKSPLVTVGVSLGAAAAAFLGFSAQLERVPQTGEMYSLRPALAISGEDRQKADALFATYEAERRPGEAAIASPYLFRYVHYPDLYWWTRLDNRPTPVWYLKDFGRTASVNDAIAAYDPKDYRVVGQNGRFILYKLRPGSP